MTLRDALRRLSPALVRAGLLVTVVCAGAWGGVGTLRGAAGAAAGAPRYGGTFTKSLNYGDPGSLDPIAKPEVAAMMVTMNLFDRLVAVDPVAKKVVPSLAERWEIRDGGLTYVFHLRKNARFHNGREITARDVKYSLERLSDPKNASPSANLLVGVEGLEAFQEGKAPEIAGVQAPDPYTLVVRLERPKPTLLMDLSAPAAGVVPREEVERLGLDFGQRPVGSGPFRLASWRKDDEIVLEAVRDYWAGRPYVDRVVFRIMREEATRDAEFQAGNLDAMTLGEAQYRRYSNDPAWKPYLVEVPELFTRAIFFNLRRPPLDQVKVRQALNYAVDKRAVVEKVLSNKAYPALGPLPSSSSAFDPNLEAYPYDPEKARQLLREAGFPQGFELEVLATAAGARTVEAVAGFLADAGVRVRIVRLESTTLFERVRSGDFQAAFYSTGGEFDPVTFLYARLHTANFGRAGNVTYYDNPEVDRLLAEGMSVTDEARRIAIARQVEGIVTREAPWLFLNYNKAVVLHQPWVHGLQPVPTDIDFQDLTKVWVEPRR
ncbi:ABC transporter substrate-binding protein [Carboxydochorda subterranea]|uniref:ABC transporter substrate-binding protein n=1 Tax=Carboxydichorda subterranea TaxID=3109565 RepID=A0ABZ1BX42_9FIRM|nr:ABC transporter substrate-binding protein [Limnochorda sp. L945t]WRP17190.1 ABC transporter substrate-binding protein [Limnochorda sp. L945t]